MRSTAFELVGSEGLEPIGVCDALRRRDEGDGAFWIDVDSYTSAELEEWLPRLNLPPLVTRMGLGGGPLQMISLPRHAYVGVTVFADEDGAGLEAIGALISGDLLVTLHAAPLAVDPLALDVLDEADPAELSPSRLLILLMLTHVQHTHRVAMRLWDTQSELDERVDNDVAAVQLDEIRAQKLAVARLAEVAESQTECFEFLSGAESDELAFSRHPGNVAQLVTAARSMRRLAERLDKTADDLRKNHEVHQQKRMTHRLNILTVITATFTPLTLLAGIWGMNFENMPGLTTTYGYAVALGVMVVITATLLRYFHRTGWFD